ncbi:MAPEG family protein [Flavimaricola marinus]|uniref:MAPEG family protein n=1 Tax=Flavimaricola marinus TaxID=1819565 RepID=A0A238LAT5_9RHOB|nr:MAPEG family protein [Flavimaricola marinus]SMY06086.1 MAPEG family protein [Flavimaricola marinus]
MSPELTILGYAALLQCLQFILYSVAANLQVGTRTALGPRDQPVQLTGKAGRLQRALNNHFEGLILFSIAVLLVYLGDKGSGLTTNLCWIYLGSRLLYVPAYYFGLSPWRTIIWAAGWLATVALLLLTLL